MELQEEVFILRPRDVVFKALNNPDILQQSIPGCEDMVQHSDTELEATVVVKFGLIKASFQSSVTLDPAEGPEKFTLSGKGDAGFAGSGEGHASVTLTEKNGGTLLAYVVKINVIGKLARLGSRLMEGKTRRMARKFFVNFEEVLTSHSNHA